MTTTSQQRDPGGRNVAQSAPGDVRPMSWQDASLVGELLELERMGLVQLHRGRWLLTPAGQAALSG